MWEYRRRFHFVESNSLPKVFQTYRRLWWSASGHSLSSARHRTHSIRVARAASTTVLPVAGRRYEMTDTQHVDAVKINLVEQVLAVASCADVIDTDLKTRLAKEIRARRGIDEKYTAGW